MKELTKLKKDVDMMDVTSLQKKYIKSIISLAFSRGREYQLDRMENMKTYRLFLKSQEDGLTPIQKIIIINILVLILAGVVAIVINR